MLKHRECQIKLRLIHFDKPIIGLTANPDEYTKEEKIEVGLNACLSKPLGLGDLALFDHPDIGGWIDNARPDGGLDARPS